MYLSWKDTSAMNLTGLTERSDFSCAPENFFRAFALAIPVRDRARLSDRHT